MPYPGFKNGLLPSNGRVIFVMVEGITYFGIERNLSFAISNGTSVRLLSDSAEQNPEQRLRAIIAQLLHNQIEGAVAEILFACIIELATNATKANMKYLYFQERGWDTFDEKDYSPRLREFKTQLHNRDWICDYARKAQEIGLWVQVLFTHMLNGIRLEVTNNLPLIPQDERRVREKMDLAQKYSSIIDFYHDHGDDVEGEGLGFAMSIMMLKQENIDPGLFRIGCDGKMTTARVEIPFSRDYRSRRGIKTENK